ncbi:WD40 repeat-like protein [Clavulina sp. PMI_390]|nr:WD40 repeat-like protein [Clavulina sp. PMI_390]
MSRRRQSTAYPYERNLLYEKYQQHSSAWERLDRVQILGDESGDVGHRGCVNALSWSSNGDTLVSSGDDTRICFWRLPNDNADRYECKLKIKTGHTANVFSAQFLPTSPLVATAAGDRQVRIFDVTRSDYEHKADASIRVLRCHSSRVKRVITQDSPSYFLSVAEDKTVRSHDLRVPHTCIPGSQSSSCPAPLVRLPNRLSTLATTPLAPWLFVVAGEMQHAYLFDRRMTGRIEERWGIPLNAAAVGSADDSVRCVRRFGRASRADGERPRDSHVTGSRMASSNGHELLLSYHADAIYKFSIHDEPGNAHSSMRQSSRQSPVLPHKTKRRKLDPTIVARQIVSEGLLTSDAPASNEAVSPGPPPVSETVASATLSDPQPAWSQIEQDEGFVGPILVTAPTPSPPSDTPLLEEDERLAEQELEHYLRSESSSDDGESSGSSSPDGPTGRTDMELLLASLREDEELSDGSENSRVGPDPQEMGSDDDSAESSEEDEDGDGDDFDGSSDDEEVDSDAEERNMRDNHAWLARPIVYPTKRYSGLCNVETVKDVNFLGHNDEYVVSGSDDGLFFLWDKNTAQIRGVWEGDDDVVNVVESHPFLPVVAVSGIDHTVKLFAPDRPDESELKRLNVLGRTANDPEVQTWASASRMHDLESILAQNADPHERLRRSQQFRLEDLAMHMGVPPERLANIALRAGGDCCIQ